VGDGALTISNGGAVVTNGLFGTLAAESTWNAEVNVVGQGSIWSLTGALLTVGFAGTAEVNILDGGNVVSFDARIAADSPSNGTVLVSGAGSTWTIGRRLGVGGDAGSLVSGGDGTLDIQPGGRVNVAQNIVVFPEGLVRLQGGTLDAADISVQTNGQFQFTSGTLHVGTFNGDLVNQGGTLAPGHSAGSTTINGPYVQQSAGILELEIGGIAPGTTHDFVSTPSLAAISGQLQLGLLNGFVPATSDTFTVLTAATGIFGTFSNVTNGGRLATFDDRGSFQVNYGPGSAFNPNHIVLSNFIPNTLPGDFNDDGTVDAADYVMWRKNAGAQAAYNTWGAHFGQAFGSGSVANANATVPELTTLTMLIVAAAAVSTRRRWRERTVSKLNDV
jgi:T5SS/PEP-CTERM-associated repeat protein